MPKNKCARSNCRLVSIKKAKNHHNNNFVVEIDGFWRVVVVAGGLKRSRKELLVVVQAEATSTNANIGEIVKIRLLEVKRQCSMSCCSIWSDL